MHPSIDPFDGPIAYWLLDLPIDLLIYLLIRPLALLLLSSLSWPGSATDHRPHTPTTTPFHSADLLGNGIKHY